MLLLWQKHWFISRAERLASIETSQPFNNIFTLIFPSHFTHCTWLIDTFCLRCYNTWTRLQRTTHEWPGRNFFFSKIYYSFYARASLANVGQFSHRVSQRMVTVSWKSNTWDINQNLKEIKIKRDVIISIVSPEEQWDQSLAEVFTPLKFSTFLFFLSEMDFIVIYVMNRHKDVCISVRPLP